MSLSILNKKKVIIWTTVLKWSSFSISTILLSRLFQYLIHHGKNWLRADWKIARESFTIHCLTAVFLILFFGVMCSPYLSVTDLSFTRMYAFFAKEAVECKFMDRGILEITSNFWGLVQPKRFSTEAHTDYRFKWDLYVLFLLR